MSPSLAWSGPLLVLGANVMMTLGVSVVLVALVMVGSLLPSKRTHRD